MAIGSLLGEHYNELVYKSQEGNYPLDSVTNSMVGLYGSTLYWLREYPLMRS